MKALGQYDGNLQMFVEGPREPDADRLVFLRWLVERGEFEHAPAGPPGGEYARAARALARADISPALRMPTRR